MTKEQIAKLDLSSGPLCCGIHEALVQRLLAEQERLLNALRGLDHYPHNETSDCWRAATNAIAFAESQA